MMLSDLALPLRRLPMMAPQSVTRDDELHDLCGAVADFQAHDVAHALLVWKVHRVAGVAVREETLADRVVGRLGPEPFGHRRLNRMRPACIAESQCMIAEVTSRLQLSLEFRKRKRDALIVGDRPTERLTLVGVVPGFV